MLNHAPAPKNAADDRWLTVTIRRGESREVWHGGAMLLVRRLLSSDGMLLVSGHPSFSVLGRPLDRQVAIPKGQATTFEHEWESLVITSRPGKGWRVNFRGPRSFDLPREGRHSRRAS